MIKEFFRKFYGFDFLKELIDDSRRDISKVYGEMFTIKDNKVASKLDELAETCKKADTTNEDAIRFILRNIKIDRKIFENYRYYLYKDLPWYIRELFMEEYGIQKEWCPYNIHYHYKNVLVGESNMYFGQFLDNINTIDKQPKGKK